MRANMLSLLFLGGAMRYYLSTTGLSSWIGERVEIATPLNAYRRMLEGITLTRLGIDPYSGDVVHEPPLLLKLFGLLHSHRPEILPLLYILLDILTAFVLYQLSISFVEQKLITQKKKAATYAANSKELLYCATDIPEISRLVLIAYLFNPLSILNCVAFTSTVFGNFMLSLILYCLVKRQLLPALLLLAFESLRGLYPVVLIAPLVLIFSRRSIPRAVAIVTLFIGALALVAKLNYLVYNSWTFLDGTLGFIFQYRDLRPNIGLFWYFFTEMFDHFRTLFLITFQMNATVLYLVPLSVKLRKEPLLLATVLIALMAVFRSYPCLGDVSYYLALLPLWRRCWKFMTHTFVVCGFFITTLGMMGALWHLWMDAGSANANFYFGATLGFSTGQIFLITDLLFAHVKREFSLRYGQKILVDGKEAKIILE